MDKTMYQIPATLIEKVLEALDNHWFSDCGEFNNDDVIEACRELEDYIKEHPP